MSNELCSRSYAASSTDEEPNERQTVTAVGETLDARPRIRTSALRTCLIFTARGSAFITLHYSTYTCVPWRSSSITAFVAPCTGRKVWSEYEDAITFKKSSFLHGYARRMLPTWYRTLLTLAAMENKEHLKECKSSSRAPYLKRALTASRGITAQLP